MGEQLGRLRVFSRLPDFNRYFIIQTEKGFLNIKGGIGDRAENAWRFTYKNPLSRKKARQRAGRIAENRGIKLVGPFRWWLHNLKT